MTTRARALRRRTTAASAALLLGLALTACSDDSGEGSEASDSASAGSSAPESDTASDTASTSPDTEEPTTDAGAAVPSESELTAALLTPDDLPAGFTESPEEAEDEDETGFEGTCFEQVGEFSDALGAEADVEAEVEYVAGQAGATSVTSQLEAYADPSGLAPAFAAFSDRLQECTSISATDDEGITYDLALDYDDTVELAGAEDQLGITMTGEISSGGQAFPVDFEFKVWLAGPFISLVGTFALGEDTTGVVAATDDLAAVQAERIQSTLG